MGAVRAPSSWPCAGWDLGIKRPVQGRPEVSPWEVPAAAGGSAVFPQCLCVSGPLLPPGGPARPLLCSELSWFMVRYQRPCTPGAQVRRRTPVAALSVRSGATEVSLEVVASCGCAWNPVEQEGRVSILGDHCGSDEDMEAQRGNGLAWGWQVGGPSATEWTGPCWVPSTQPVRCCGLGSRRDTRVAVRQGALRGRLW